jgi:hydrogenase large subunit
VGYSWYAKATNNLNPANGVTTPEYPKSGAYTWLKAPRYLGLPYETGPLARMIVNGDYSKTTISAMDRHVARAYEALKIAQAALTWLNGLSTTGAYYTPYTAPASATTVGLTEAARGALGHWVKVTNGVISNYQIITPTCWNASPRDGAGNLGPIEKALVGTPIRNVNEPIEVARVIHSFDPCLSCAVHIMRPKNKETVFTLSAGGCAS